MLRLHAVAAVVVVAWLGHAARADDPGQPPETDAVVEEPPAVKAFEEGRKLLEDSKFAEACARFEESIQLDPDAPGTLLNLGLCNARLGKTATALGWFRKAQFRAAETNKTEYEDAAKQETLTLVEIVPKAHIELANPAPPSATFLLDGNQIAEVDMQSLEVDPGPHALEMRVPGKPPLRVELIAKLGHTTNVVVPVPKLVKEIIVVDHGAPQKALAYLLGGTGISLYIASAAVSVIARREFDSSEHPEDRQHWTNVARFGGTPLFIVGTAAVASAVYLYVRAPHAERIERTVIAPSAGDHQVGVAVVGSF